VRSSPGCVQTSGPLDAPDVSDLSFIKLVGLLKGSPSSRLVARPCGRSGWTSTHVGRGQSPYLRTPYRERGACLRPESLGDQAR
jgi:hypothetical protein